MRKNIIAVVGNPNCGKTTLFNGLTSSHQTVGNWPGVTVERIVGEFTYKDREITIVDLPGIYSLQPSSASSEDERVARDYILQDEAELIVNIVDASNLERNLYLTTQLLEMQVPMIVVLNMLDMAAAHQIEIDPHKLSEALGCPVIGIVAAKEQGLKELCAAIDAQLDDLRIPKNPIVFADDVEAARAEIAKLLSAQKVERAEWTAEQLLEGDAGMGDYLKGVDLTEVDKIIAEINQKYNGDLDIAMADVRYSFVSQATAASMIRKGESDQIFANYIHVRIPKTECKISKLTGHELFFIGGNRVLPPDKRSRRLQYGKSIHGFRHPSNRTVQRRHGHEPYRHRACLHRNRVAAPSRT